MKSPQEEAYFAQLNAERRSQLRTELTMAARELNSKRALKTVLRTDDDALVQRIRALGFDGDSVRVLDLLPLIWVSWADGRIQRSERIAILELLRARGISYESEAWILVEALLEERPSDGYLEEALVVLKALRQKQGSTSDIVALSHAIADAAGGLSGLGSVSREERATLERVAAVLGGEAVQKLHALLG
jgi:tellurite resistance protein